MRLALMDSMTFRTSPRGRRHKWEAACEREHRIADTLQRVLLRASPVEMLHGFSVETYYEAALDEATVGGDSCDAFAIDCNRVALAVADASGKGLAAAERVAEVRFALRAFLREHGDPPQAVSCLNTFVCDTSRLTRRSESSFVTLTLVILDAATGYAECLCAGGEPPFILRSSGAVEIIPALGTALGIDSEQTYTSRGLWLESDDLLFLTTDGLTEARRPQQTDPIFPEQCVLLGLDGLAQLASRVRAPSAPLSQIGRSVFEGARAFGGGAFRDDACLLIGQRSGFNRAGNKSILH